MSIETTLARVEREISGGDLGKARDRLHGLIATYPNELSLRHRLGSIYMQLQDPTLAGRYWYLAEDKTDAVMDACDTFERAFRSDPLLMLNAIRFRGDVESLTDTFAQSQLRELQSAVHKIYAIRYEFTEKGAGRFQREPTVVRFSLISAGCFTVAVILATVFVVGLVSCFEFIAAWLMNG